ncbi:hypothetical protein ACIGEO_12925 [Stenotrophomonas bentonitica]|uniref:hypothetical protein n=1 Tax=Stenotrophomonas bentonitica TaxID=1450134 RepID=UPI0037D722B6
MRDIKAGRDIRVQGDLNVTSNRVTRICDLDDDGLIAEKVHRKELLAEETRSKWKRISFAWLGFVVIIIAVAMYLRFTGEPELGNLVLSVGGVVATLSSLKYMVTPNEFEARQQATLKEIKTMLRERRVE